MNLAYLYCTEDTKKKKTSKQDLYLQDCFSLFVMQHFCEWNQMDYFLSFLTCVQIALQMH